MNTLPHLRGLLAGTILAGGAAHAADRCAALSSPLSRQACARPATAALQDKMTRDLARASKALSADGAQKLQASQQAWRRFVDKSCDASAGPSASGQDEAPCVSNALHTRITELAQVGLRAGPLVLTLADRYDIAPAPVRADLPPDFRQLPFVWQIDYPQIDDAASPAALAWNRRQEPAWPTTEDSRPTQLFVNYDVGCASDRLLSLQFVTYEFSQGAAHGNTGLQARNFVVDPTLRAMTPDDLFGPDSDWEDKLPDLVWQAYLDGGGQFASDAKFEANVRAAAAQPDHWLLTPQGLQIGFSSYEAGCYACGPGPLTVPWAKLASMLANKSAPVCRTGANDPD